RLYPAPGVLRLAERGPRDGGVGKGLPALVLAGAVTTISSRCAWFSAARHRHHKTGGGNPDAQRVSQHRACFVTDFWNRSVAKARCDGRSARDVHFDSDRRCADDHLFRKEISLCAVSIPALPPTNKNLETHVRDRCSGGR